jgi:hypothetical protein
MASERVTVTYDLDRTVAPTVPTGRIILNFLLSGGDPEQNVQTCMFDQEGYEMVEPVSLYSVNNLRDEIARLGDTIFVYSKPFEEDDDKIYAWNTLIDFIDRQQNKIIYTELRERLEMLITEIVGVEEEFVEVVERVAPIRPVPVRSSAPITHSGVKAYSKSLRPPERKVFQRKTPPAEEVVATRKRVTSPSRRSEEDDFYEEKYTTTPVRSTSPRRR